MNEKLHFTLSFVVNAQHTRTHTKQKKCGLQMIFRLIAFLCNMHFIAIRQACATIIWLPLFKNFGSQYIFSHSFSSFIRTLYKSKKMIFFFSYFCCRHRRRLNAVVVMWTFNITYIFYSFLFFFSCLYNISKLYLFWFV